MYLSYDQLVILAPSLGHLLEHFSTHRNVPDVERGHTHTVLSLG